MLLLVLALWKRGGVTAWMSVRSIGGIYDEGYTTTRENVATRVFFRSFLEDVSTGRGAGGRARRARVLGRRTPVNPPSLTGRRPDASATSLCARWSGAREAGVSGGSGLEHDRRARTRVACFSQAVGTARRGLATTRRRRKGARRGTASAQTRHAYPSHRSDSLGSASSTSESEESSESDSALAVGDLAGAGTPSAALIALGSKPRGASARGGRAHERAPAVSRRRANAAFRSVSRWTRAPPYRAPS